MHLLSCIIQEATTARLLAGTMSDKRTDNSTSPTPIHPANLPVPPPDSAPRPASPTTNTTPPAPPGSPPVAGSPRPASPTNTRPAPPPPSPKGTDEGDKCGDNDAPPDVNGESSQDAVTTDDFEKDGAGENDTGDVHVVE